MKFAGLSRMLIGPSPCAPAWLSQLDQTALFPAVKLMRCSALMMMHPPHIHHTIMRHVSESWFFHTCKLNELNELELVKKFFSSAAKRLHHDFISIFLLRWNFMEYSSPLFFTGCWLFFSLFLGGNLLSKAQMKSKPQMGIKRCRPRYWVGRRTHEFIFLGNFSQGRAAIVRCYFLIFTPGLFFLSFFLTTVILFTSGGLVRRFPAYTVRITGPQSRGGGGGTEASSIV